MSASTSERFGQPPASESERRTTCNVCGLTLDLETAPAPVRCNVRRFSDQTFHFWRCAGCQCIHCLEIVDLDPYYQGYGTKDQRLNFLSRIAYGRLLARFRAAGVRRGHRFLDYGCGSGNFVSDLHQRGYGPAVGYDPYGGPTGVGDPSVLEASSFDAICLQDVIEHVEDAAALVVRLSGLLKNGGVLLVGTPSADEISLEDTWKHLHQLHAPYHLHLYTRAALVGMGRAAGLSPIAFYRRFYAETPLLAMNEAFCRAYLARLDDTIDSLVERPHVGLVLRSPTLLFHAAFGFWYSPRHSMTVVFRKEAGGRAVAGENRAALPGFRR